MAFSKNMLVVVDDNMKIKKATYLKAKPINYLIIDRI